MKMENKKNKGSNLKKHYVIAFWVSMSVSLALLVGGFLTPPKGEISGSVLEGAGIIFLWPSLAFAAKALEENNKIKITHGSTAIEVGRKKGEEFIETPIEDFEHREDDIPTIEGEIE